jgi:cellulose 1,4-beta-cellobiosidase
MKKNINLFGLIRIFVLFFVTATIPVFGQASLLGDVDGNGTVNIVDALLVARHYVGYSTPVFDAAAADANASGAIDIVDALVIAQYYVGILTSLPPGTPAPAATPTSTPVEPKPANPYSGAKTYVNPDWSAKASAGGGASIANSGTAVWLDSIASITAPYFGGMGLRGHMDNALSQGANLITLVLYNLPNRDCQYAASNGELVIDNYGLARYKSEFIDPIVAILGDPKYSDLRIAVIVEPDSLPNLITNLSFARCMEVNSSGTYATGIQYAINKLNTLGNTYMYVDIAYSAWLGWSENMQRACEVITNVIKGTSLGVLSISGFSTNVAQYIPLEEPFLPDTSLLVGGNAVKSARFCDWNPYIDELDYANEMYRRFVELGFPSSIGMIVDTSRNGWGGPDRPTAMSTSSDVNVYVDQSRVDRRFHRGNWCNQRAGIGARPQANPAPHIHAFVWAKEPGISDGASSAYTDPANPSLVLYSMCGPNNLNIYCGCGTTGAMPNAPHLGKWFQDQFDVLLANAYPPL